MDARASMLLSLVLCGLVTVAGCGSDAPANGDEPTEDMGTSADMATPSPDMMSPPATPWSAVGFGVNYRTTGRTTWRTTWRTTGITGNNVFIGYAGYNESDAQSEAWVDALEPARLQALGTTPISSAGRCRPAISIRAGRS